MRAPIALFVYNRPEHCSRTLEALSANDLASESALYIFSDGPSDVSDVQAVAAVRRAIKGCAGFERVEVIESAENRGLSASIIAGVSRLAQEFGRVIVLEDDMLTSPYFLRYMNAGLDVFADVKNVASIHGYMYPHEKELPETFFMKGANCWGWATWERAWREFNADGSSLLERMRAEGLVNAFNMGGAYPGTAMLQAQIAGKNDSWAVRWHASVYVKGMYTLFPGRSLVKNIGMDATGRHCEVMHDYDVNLSDKPVRVEMIPVEESAEGRRAIRLFHRHLTARRSRVHNILGWIVRRMRLKSA